MERQITIDGRQYHMVANGASPRIYRGMFGKDVFKDTQKMISADGTINDSEVFENLAFLMAIQGGEVSTGTRIEDWLAGMDSPTAILSAAPDIVGLWNDNMDQTSEAKKK